nr:PREDICTED: coiled-coil domain-containing protein 181 [Latimeria chalumnae]|eukprot:XP_005993475.1 PREDICTED: coiled-coil domain-containing protein 181 [Latimeria chalumnae]
MTEKEESGDPDQAVEYEDDFEKDLDWLINEEEKGSDGKPEEHDDDDGIEAKIDKELNDNDTDEEAKPEKEEPSQGQSENPATTNEDVSADSSEPALNSKPSEPISGAESEGSFQEAMLNNHQDNEDEDDEEVKRYIMEKIEQANRQLEDEEPVDEHRERKLKFKDNLVDLEVPPLEYVETDNENDIDVSGKMSKLHISTSPMEKNSDTSTKGEKDDEANKDKKVLVERDGKFELLNLWDIANQGLLPPINGAFSENEPKQSSPRSSFENGSGPLNGKGDEPLFRQSVNGFLPKPPSVPRGRSNSVTNTQRNVGKRVSPRRVQSANLTQRKTTYWLTDKQKEFQKKIEEKKLLQHKKEEARKREEEKQKMEENEMAFNAWLQKKKTQLESEKRIQRAMEMERMNTKVTKAILAFYRWLKRKKEEKRAEQLAAKERSRKLMMEARKARRMQTLMYSINESKTFRFVDHYGYRF